MVWTTVFGARQPPPAGFGHNLVAENAHLHALLDEAAICTKRMEARASVIEGENAAALHLQRVLNEEMHHRATNSLAVIRAIASQTLKTAGSLVLAQAALEGRLAALSRAQDILIASNWSSARLADVVSIAIAPFDDLNHPRITLDIGMLEVNSTAVLPLTLSLNELCTNATKYGALSDGVGRVALSMIRAHGEGVVLTWTERDGPLVLHPSRTSFGTKLLTTLALQMNGTAQLSYEPSGFVYELRASLESRPVATLY